MRGGICSVTVWIFQVGKMLLCMASAEYRQELSLM